MALIQFEHLEKTYGEKTQSAALHDVSLVVEKGEFAAIMGPSGSGKSTIMNIMGFLDRPTQGIYRFEEKIANAYSDNELAVIRNTKIGFVFQSFHLLPYMTVYQNIMLPLIFAGINKELSREKTLAVIESVGLSHKKDSSAELLSGGEKQRVALARAIVNNPEMILADEPTGNLDSVSGHAVMETLKTLNIQGHTIVLVTHEHAAALYASRIIYIKDGLIEREEKSSPAPNTSVAEYVK